MADINPNDLDELLLLLSYYYAYLGETSSPICSIDLWFNTMEISCI